MSGVQGRDVREWGHVAVVVQVLRRTTSFSRGKGLAAALVASCALVQPASADVSPSQQWATSGAGEITAPGASIDVVFGESGVTATILGASGTGFNVRVEEPIPWGDGEFVPNIEPDAPAGVDFGVLAGITEQQQNVQEFSFNKPVIAPILYLGDLEQSSVTIEGSTVASGPITLTILAKNAMEVTGNTLNSNAPHVGQNGFWCSPPGGNPNQSNGCGSFRLDGPGETIATIESFTLDNQAFGGGDGWGYSVSFPTAPLTKEFSPAQIPAGETSTLTFAIANPDNSEQPELTPLDFTDVLPDGLIVADGTVVDNGSCGSPTVTDSEGGALDAGDIGVTASDISVAAGATCTIAIQVTSTTPGTYVNDNKNLSTTVANLIPDASTTLEVSEPPAEPAISIDKSGGGPDPLEVGSTIEYSFLVTNVGNVTLTGIEINDPLVSPVDCPQTELEPQADMTCTGSYTVTQADVDAGVVENTAEVSGTPEGGQPPVTDEDTTVFPPDQAAGISIEKSGSGPEPLTVGSTIEYEFLVTNTGNVTLNDVTIEDPLDGLSPIDCPNDTLAPGAEMTCTATYEVTQTDVDAGVIENTATATGQTPGGGPPPTDESTTTFPPEEPVPALPPLALVLLLALLGTATLWTLRRARV